MVDPPFRCLRASALSALVPPFDRRRAFVRLHFTTTGSRPSDSPRVIINIDRASRDLAYFFYHLPVDRISWAFPYVPPGLYTQLLGAPGLTTRNKKLLGAKGIATRSKDATRSSWPYY